MCIEISFLKADTAIGLEASFRRLRSNSSSSLSYGLLSIVYSISS